MNDDDPSDVVHERFAEARPRRAPARSPDRRHRRTRSRRSARDDIADHYRRHYTAPGLVVTAAGGIDHDARLRARRRARRHVPMGVAVPTGRRPRRCRAGRHRAASVRIDARGRTVVVRRPTEQANVVLGTTGLTATDERRYVMSVLNAVLGGGMSSRLFQEVREKRGLAYSVYSFASGYSDSGYFGLYAGCAPAKVDEVLALLRRRAGAARRGRCRRRGAAPRPRPDLRRAGARPGGLRVADVPAGQGRARAR